MLVPGAPAALVLALVAGLGLALGSVKVKGVGLTTAGVLFVGLFLGHLGVSVEPAVLEFARDFGLILFVTSIGLQVGPGFVSSLRRSGLKLNLLAAAVVLSGVALAAAAHLLLGVELPAVVGILSGATTNTPSLAAAQQALKEVAGEAAAAARAATLPPLGYAVASGVELEHGLTRNHYLGRTFIQPTPALREMGVRMKLHPVRKAIEGRRVTVIDDSLVRGTTSRQMVRLLREAGAREVHLRLSSPPLRFPCFFGIDIPTREELISNRFDPAGIAREIGADSVTFLSLEALRGCVDNPGDFCTACFSGEYPCPVRDAPVARKC